MSTLTKNNSPGLKKAGIVVVQSFLIALSTFIELMFRNGLGIITGLVLLVAFFGGIRFGRPGTQYVSVVTPPLAFAASALFWITIFNGFKPARIGIDFIAALASEAPFLIIGSLFGWFIFLNAKAKKRPPKPRS